MVLYVNAGLGDVALVHLDPLAVGVHDGAGDGYQAQLLQPVKFLVYGTEGYVQQLGELRGAPLIRYGREEDWPRLGVGQLL